MKTDKIENPIIFFSLEEVRNFLADNPKIKFRYFCSVMTGQFVGLEIGGTLINFNIEQRMFRVTFTADLEVFKQIN